MKIIKNILGIGSSKDKQNAERYNKYVLPVFKKLQAIHQGYAKSLEGYQEMIKKEEGINKIIIKIDKDFTANKHDAYDIEAFCNQYAEDEAFSDFRNALNNYLEVVKSSYPTDHIKNKLAEKLEQNQRKDAKAKKVSFPTKTNFASNVKAIFEGKIADEDKNEISLWLFDVTLRVLEERYAVVETKQLALKESS